MLKIPPKRTSYFTWPTADVKQSVELATTGFKVIENNTEKICWIRMLDVLRRLRLVGNHSCGRLNLKVHSLLVKLVGTFYVSSCSRLSTN
jgi:hypothetical protein